ncbi:hypothetical protein ACL02T_13595 [Pseudonocardia sp. RS010]|uniref:hypothetical protein n=1 Tax=Pseudonocardia sp. RS010 TaxID=3385979 RepID=UPI0039A2C2B4
MNAPTSPTGTPEALGRARDQAAATLSSLGGTVEEFAHEVAGKVEENLPVLAARAGRVAGRVEAVAGAAAATALDRLDEGVLAARRELAARIDPGTPSPRRWWWIGAGLLVTALSIAGWFVLSRRPQPVESITEPPSTVPPTDVDLEPGTLAAPARDGRS